MGRIITFANQKGGVGKTTSAVNIAAEAGALGKKVLLVDNDPQGNASSAVGLFNKKSFTHSTYTTIIDPETVRQSIQKTNFDNLDVMPSNINLAGAEIEIIEFNDRHKRLKNALDQIKDEYDYIFIDCPPTLGLLTVNALVASDGIIIPMQCEYFALEGLAQLSVSIKKVKQMYNPKLELVGILITMYNGRLNLSVQVMSELKKYYSDKLFKTVIARTVRLSEAPSYGKPIKYFDKHSKGSQAYEDVTREIFERI
ncbi:MAG: ParA family protein [Clostridia bacterium]|nr:ParA family protein [Clostridia bacterium]